MFLYAFLLMVLVHATAGESSRNLQHKFLCTIPPTRTLHKKLINSRSLDMMEKTREPIPLMNLRDLKLYQVRKLFLYIEKTDLYINYIIKLSFLF